MTSEGPWTEPQRRVRMYFRHADTGEVIELQGPVNLEISYPPGGYLDDIEFRISQPDGVTIPCKLMASHRTLRIMGMIPPWRLKRACRRQTWRHS